MKKVLIAIVGLGVFVAGGLAVSKNLESRTGDKPVMTAQADEATTKFAIENMTCASCPITVRKAMMRVDGVKEVDVDFDAKTATVTYDPNVASPSQIADASTQVGYPATNIDAS